MSSWFLQCMPRIKDVQSHLSDIAASFNRMEGIRGMYVWGSYSANINHPNYRVRDIDLLARTRFHSEDLIAVGDEIIKQASTDDSLENMGYDPQCVAFSREFTKLSKYNMDFWAISSDRKLLHWGPVMVDQNESIAVNEEAEAYAQRETGIDRKKIGMTEEHLRRNWYKSFDKYLSMCFQGMPSGWYKTEDVKMKDILSQAIKL